MDRDIIVNFINSYLENDLIKDYSKNGLQVEGKEKIEKILFSVSISLEVIKKAIEIQADMIIVHHGLFWGIEEVIKGKFKEKMKLLIENDINLCAWHLPLDKHNKIGNNVSIINFFKPVRIKPFGFYEGQKISYEAYLRKPEKLKDIVSCLVKNLNASPLVLDFGPDKVRRFAVVSGGGQKMFKEAVEKKLDLYITGEASEFCFEMARENKINFIAAGHYNTEKTGILALKKLIEEKFKLKTFFFDTGNPI